MLSLINYTGFRTVFPDPFLQMHVSIVSIEIARLSCKKNKLWLIRAKILLYLITDTQDDAFDGLKISFECHNLWS